MTKRGDNINKEKYELITKYLEEGLNWQQIADKMNDIYNDDKSPTTYRKPYTAYKQGYEDSASDKDLDLQLQRIRRERKQLGIERSINNEQIRDLSIRDVITEQIKEGIHKVNKRKRHNFIPFYNEMESELVFFISDMHYNGDYEYGKMLIDKIYKHIYFEANKHKANRITIVDVGDMIEGATLRASQLQAIKKGMIQQTVEVSRLVSELIQELSFNFNVDYHMITSSNHTQLRNVGTQRNELMDEDVSLWIHAWIDKVFEDNEAVTVNGGQNLLIDIKDKKIFVEHGHHKKITANNFADEAMKISQYYEQNIDHFVFGHFHHFEEKQLNNANKKYKSAFLMPTVNSKYEDYEKDNRFGGQGGIVMLEFDTNGIGNRKFLPVDIS